MRSWAHRRSASTLTAVLAAAVAVSSVATAHADLVVNGLDDSINTTIEVMPLDLKTGPGTTTIYVLPTDDDNDPGCNFDGASETVTVNIASSDPAVATVSPSSLVLSACGKAGAQLLTVTPVGTGSATMTTTVATGTNKTGGAFTVANARFSVRVTAVPNTPPTLDIVGVEEGGEYAKGTLARPSCVATDPDDFPTSPHTKTWLAPLTEISGPYAVDGIGTRYAQCAYTDEGGVQVLARTGFAIVDETAPGIGRVLDPVPDGTGWFRGDVSLIWKVTEAQSPSSLRTTGCEEQLVDVDTKLTTFTCSATSAGGTHSLPANIRRDATAPVVSPTSTLAGGGTVVNGWHTAPVDVTFTATDATSLFLVDGRVVGTASQTVTTSGDGTLVVESPAFTDRAGNSSAVGAATRTVKVDASAPSIPAFVGGPTGSHYFGDVPAAPTCTSTDTGSGLASCLVTGGGATVGKHVYTATATDHAGHTSTADLPYEVLAWTVTDFTDPVDMGGVPNAVKGGSTVPAKFEVFVGEREVTDTSLVTMSNRKITCPSGVAATDVEELTTGSTSLRYDTTAGRYQYNWKLPTGKNVCYALTATAADGSSVTASFLLK